MAEYKVGKQVWASDIKQVSGYVRTEVSYGSWGKLVPATINRLLKGKIMQDAMGNPLIYDKSKQVIGRVFVEYDTQNKPFIMDYKNKLIAWRVR